MAYLAPDTIGGGPYLSPDEPPATVAQQDGNSRTVSIVLESRSGVLRANISGIYWEYSDVRGTVRSSGVTSSNSASLVSVAVNSALDVGAKGLLKLDNYTGFNDASYFAFFGPVMLS